MRIIYEEPIEKKILEEIHKAHEQGNEIELIKLSDSEARQLYRRCYNEKNKVFDELLTEEQFIKGLNRKEKISSVYGVKIELEEVS